MQIRSAVSPGIFNFQPTSRVQPRYPQQDAAASSFQAAATEETATRLPDSRYDHTFDEATQITTALLAALNSGERVSPLLQEIV